MTRHGQSLRTVALTVVLIFRVDYHQIILSLFIYGKNNYVLLLLYVKDIDGSIGCDDVSSMQSWPAHGLHNICVYMYIVCST